MNQFAYNIASSQEFGRQVTLIVDGETSTIDETHHSFDAVVEALLSGEYQEAIRLVNSGGDIRRKFLGVSDRVSVQGNTIYFDGEPLYTKLAETILDFYRNGRDFTRLVRFAERLMENPSYNSRNQLYEYLDRYNFVITEEGNFIAYKGLRSDGTSIHAGYGVVDGVEYQNAHLPNNEGSVVQIPRSMVDDNPNAACSAGLHAGTFDYAHKFGQGMTVKVEIDPRHVVSIPHDVSHQKIRTSEYLVLEQTEQEIDENDYYVSTSYVDNDWEEDDWETDWDYDDTDYSDVREYLIDELRTVASNYSRKGKVGDSYREILENVFGGPLTETEEEVVEDMDDDHHAQAVYRYHIDRL